MAKSTRRYLQRKLAVLAISLILVAAAASGKPSSLEERSHATSLDSSQEDAGLQLTTGFDESGPLLVTTLDGQVAAIDKQTGETLWTFDTENALISATGSPGYSFNVVPGVQGELYTQPRGGQGGFQMLPETLPEWVEKTPFMMSDGSLWLGSRHTHAFYVDPDTGKLIKSVVEYGDAGAQEDVISLELPNGRRPILMGRVDYRVRAIHQDTGLELFNVSYSRLSLLDSSLKLPSFGDTHALDAGSEAGQLGLSLDPERKNFVRRVDSRTGEEIWSVGFAQPPVTVFAGGEIGMSLYGAPAWPIADGIAARLGVSKKKQASIMVESIHGHYYALPMVTPQQQSGFIELMPADSSKVIQAEAEQCKLEDSVTPPSPDEVINVEVAKGREEGNESDWQDVLGIHYLDTTPSFFVTERLPIVKDQDSKGLLFGSGGMVADMGMLSMSVVAGAGAVAFLAFALINQRPRVIATLKKDKGGVRKLTLSYTGTTAEAEAARKKGKEVEEESPAIETSNRIRDLTGSGEEHLPEQEDSGEADGPSSDPAVTNPESSSRTSAEDQNGESSPEIGGQCEKGKSWKDDSEQSGSDGSRPSRSSLKRKKRKAAAAALTAGATPFEQRAGNGFETGSNRSAESSSSDEADGRDGSGRVGNGRPSGGSGPESETHSDSGLNKKASDSSSQDSDPGSGGGGDPGGGSGKGVGNRTSFGDGGLETGSGGSGGNENPSSRQSSHLRRSEWRDGVTYVGRLAIGPGIVGYGSSGTLVFEGSLDGRQVAVKRVLRQFYELARKEIGALIVADEHPNIVRCFAMEEDTEFVYLALERCKQSLNDVLGGGNPEESWRFVDANGMPTELCMRVCEEVGRGLLALHERSIVHRDLKPHNVLFTEGMRTKLSDMGLCKRLTTDQTSYDSAGPGGSTGWQAPEQLILRSGGEARQGRSVDIFTFGLLLFYCLSGGQHPYGEGVERDYRILNGRADLGALSALPEAMNMIRAMLRPQPKQRPSVGAIMAHPFWWDPSRKLAFLVELSNRLENEDREVDRSLLRSLESCAEEAIGGNSWAAKLDPEFLANLGRYRKYNPGSLRDLLRVIRNKHNHFREMPEGLQERIGRTPEAFVGFFAERFPGLLLTAYSFALSHCSHESLLQKYFPITAKDFPFASAAVAGRLAQKKDLPQAPPLLKDSTDRTSSAPSAWKREPPLATVDELRETTQRAKSDTNLLPPPPLLPKTGRAPPKIVKSGHREWWSPSESSSSAAGSDASLTSSSLPDPEPVKRSSFPDPSTSTSSSPSRSSLQLPAWGPRDSQLRRPLSQGLPPKGGPGPGSMTLTAASLPLKESAVNLLSAPADAEGSLTVDDSLAFARAAVEVPASLKMIQDPEGHVTVFPQRPGGASPECDFFLKTGSCKFGAGCHFHHPLSYSVKMSAVGDHPIRPNQPVCPFYDRTGSCKFGPACKFHHPSTSRSISSHSGSTSQQTATGSTSSDQRPFTNTNTSTNSLHSSDF